MTKRREDETEPMTRLLGTLVSEPPGASEPHKRLVNVVNTAEQTRLEIARPRVSTSEPATQLIHAPSARPAYSLDTATIPGSPRRPQPPLHADDTRRDTPPLGHSSPNQSSTTQSSPALLGETRRDSPPPGRITPVFAPRLSQADQDEITASRAASHRRTPFLLAVALVLVCFATGASLLRARIAKRHAQAAAQPASAVLEPEQTQPDVKTVPIAAPTPPATPEAQPEAKAPEPVAPIAAKVAATAPAPVIEQAAEESLDELEKRAVDRLQANDHQAALTAYTELSRRQPKQEAYALMVTLLGRRVHACQGDPSCAH